MKIRAIPLCLYILSLFFLTVGCVSLIACHHTITAQLSQGVPVDGNELQILNLYLQSCAEHLAFSVLFFLGGRVYRIFVPPKAAEPSGPFSPRWPSAVRRRSPFPCKGWIFPPSLYRWSPIWRPSRA